MIKLRQRRSHLFTLRRVAILALLAGIVACLLPLMLSFRNSVRSSVHQFARNEELEQAAIAGDAHRVDELIYKGASVDYDAGAIVHHAWVTGDPATLAAVMEAHPRLQNVLGSAVMVDDLAFAEYLICHGAEPSQAAADAHEDLIALARTRQDGRLASMLAHPETVRLPRITVERAEQLVRDWRRQHPSQFNRSPGPKLIDATPDEVWDILGGQIFRLSGYTGSVDEPDAFFIRRGVVTPIAIGFGGYGLLSACVTRLDGGPRLVYTYSWGSGLHRTHLGMLDAAGATPVTMEAPFVVTQIDVELKHESHGKLAAYIGTTRLGPVTLDHGAPTIDLDPALPPTIRRLIWYPKR